MKRLIALSLMLGLLTIASPGCGEKSSTTKETKITTPGGTTTIKTEQEIKKTGENPPATP